MQTFKPRFPTNLVAALVFVAAGASDRAAALDFVVDSTMDAVDESPGDGVCASAGGACTLRAAVMEANATSGADRIDLSGMDDPAQPIQLTLSGVDETFMLVSDGPEPCVAQIEANAAIGDLDITEDVEIFGAGPALTIIEWNEQSITDPDVGDRIFHIQAESGTTVELVAISDLMVRSGSVGILNDTSPDNAYNCDVSETPNGAEAWQFRRYGGGIAIGPGAAVTLFQEGAHGGGSEGGPPDGGEEETGGVTAVELSRVAVIGNQSGSDAGGIMVTAEVTLLDSVLSGNISGGNGGGAYLDSPSLIRGCTLGVSESSIPYESGELDAVLLANPNEAENGGALFDTGFHVTEIQASAINGNAAIGGAGIGARANVVINITNTTISGNVASDVGGGVTTNGTINLRNATVVDNVASSDAPGGGAGLNSFGSGTFTLVNTVLTDNVVQGAEASRDANCGCSGGTAMCPPGTIVSTGFNIEGADTCLLDAALNDLVNTDPLLMPLANNGGLTETHALPSEAAGDAATSPAIDAGDDLRCPNNDQRGSIRPDDGDLDGSYICDVGAFELFISRSDLHINNVIAPDEVDKGDAFDVVVEIHNDSPDVTAEDVVLDSTLDAGLTATAAQTTVGTCDVTADAVSCSLGAMATGAVETVTIGVSADAAGVFDVNNVISTSTMDPEPGNNEATVTIAVVGNSDLALSGMVPESGVTVGDDIVLTYTVTNEGEDDATGTRLGMTVPAEVGFVSAEPDPGSCTESLGEVACALGELAVGESASVTVTLSTDVAAMVDIIAEVGADQNDPDGTNNVSSIMVEVTEGGGGCGCDVQAPGSTAGNALLVALVTLLLVRRKRQNWIASDR
ncbi:MAG: DUF11 domain-containing protein [Myxococcales bacterium]|jgi:CSLREA domain-containing protein/uncharacterized repeat protein (TIGR01451 family)